MAAADTSLFDIFMKDQADKPAPEEIPTISKAEVATQEAKADSVVEEHAVAEADAAAAADAMVQDVPPAPKEKKPRKPRKSKGVKKTQHDKTEKEAKATTDKIESRHCPGYSMLRVERDKIDRSRLALLRKNEARAAQGKPAPTVCSILNDRLIEFYTDVAGQFDSRFGKYLKS